MASRLPLLTAVLFCILQVATSAVPLFPQRLVRNLPCFDDYYLICRNQSKHGGCTKNAEWMKWNCRRSCDMCHLKYVCTNTGLRVELPSDCPPRMFEMSDYEIQQRIAQINDKFRYPKMQNGKFSLAAPPANSIQILSNISGTQQRMFDGDEAATDTLKYHVQLIDYQTKMFCGGVAIGKHFVLTAGHCVVNYTIGHSSTQSAIMWTGSLKFGQGYQHHITKIAVHEEYAHPNDASTKREHDIALVFTKDEINSQYIINLSDRREKKGERVQLSGFGDYRRTPDGSPYIPDWLQVADYNVLDEEPGDTEHTFITSGEVGYGDSGSPLTWKDNQGQDVLGGVIRGKINLNAYNEQSPNNVAEYIRVFDFIDWIKAKQTELMSDEVFGENFGKTEL